ncbi:bifunctional MaoC family dehydratase N-terminal/OB-fold nucleic acid binding domain-containing protein [Actinokineospora sp. HUAS TT18]|uniref:bifunctional MaoC family dehydratase N-terminal/OB-fold nucleic acid binding domain-containing protein n=1 Tax=Actinokineospora sp. HUAS TT18 TaxID=3447451 RepID=UPI003F5236CB
MTYEDRLQAFVGRTITPLTPGQDPVNVPMIRHWVEAMGDENPIYLSDEAAKAAGRPGIVAPASMAQAWTMRGYAATMASGPAHELTELLAEGGYTSVVATDSDFDFARELRPGDHISAEEVVESISPEKSTALGVGRFVSSLRTYRDGDGEVVATQRWRILRFRPKQATAPRPRPAVNLDNQFWFEAAKAHRLLIQRCAACATLRHPPGPCCPHCQSFDWDTVEASGSATLHSYVVAHHPKHPAFEYPLVIAVVDLAEGTRLVTNLVGVDAADVTIGMPLTLDWLDADPDLTLPVFRPAEER